MAEGVSQRHLAQERKPLPQRLYPLQQDALAGLGRFGPDQLRRPLAQLLAAGQHRHQYGAEQRHRHAGGAHAQAEIELQGGVAVNNIVGIPDDKGDHRHAQHKAQNAAHQGRTAGIPQVFSHNHPAGKAHGLQGADLGALVVDHAGHGGHTDQRRDEHEEHREGPRHGGDDAGVVFKGHIAGIGLPVQGEYFQLQLLIGVDDGLGQLRFRVLQLFFAVGKLPLGLSLALFILFPALVHLALGLFQLHPSLVQLLLALGHGHFGIFDLRLGGVQLGSALGNGLFPGGDLRLGGRHLGLCLVQLGLSRGNLRLLGRELLRRAVPGSYRGLPAALQLLHPGVEDGKPGLIAQILRVKGVDLLLGLADLAVDEGNGLLQRPEHGVFCRLQLGLALGQLLLARLNLRNGRFQRRLALLKLLFLLVQHGPVVRDLLQSAGDLLPALVDLFLLFLDLRQPVVDLFLALIQLCSGAAQLLLDLFFALMVFLPALVQLRSGLRQLLVRLTAQLLIAHGAPAVQQGLDLRLQLVPGGNIFRGVHLPGQVAVQQDLLIDLLVEGLLRQQHKTAEIAGAQRGAAPVMADIPGAFGQAHNGKLPLGKKAQSVLVIQVAYAYSSADIVAAEGPGVAQAFVGVLRHPPLGQIGCADRFGDGHEAVGLLMAAQNRQSVRKEGALRVLHALQLLEGGHIPPGQAQGGHELEIVHPLVVHIAVRRLQHGGLRALQARVKAHAQGDDGHDGQIAPQRAFDAAQQHFHTEPVHLLTTRSLPRG